MSLFLYKNGAIGRWFGVSARNSFGFGFTDMGSPYKGL